jgi:hypothetical protein
MEHVEIGQKLPVRWFCLGSNQEEIFEVTVVAVKRTKTGGFRYTLLFPLGETRKTKSLSEKMIVSLNNKRKPDIVLTQPIKSFKRFALPPHRFILAPMVPVDFPVA